MKRSFLICACAFLIAGLAIPASAHEAGKWVLRAGVGQVNPKSDNLSETIDAGDGTTITAALNVDTGTSLTLTGTYFFTQNWAFDILAAWPFQHDVNASITIDDGSGTPVSLSGKIAEVEHLPPTFSAQYHFLPDAKFQPFVGLGVNYTTFLSEKLVDVIAEDGTNLGPIGETLSLDDSFGVAVQVGADWMLSDNWLINFDLRWMDINSDATLDGLELGTVEIDPWVYSINVGYAFR